MPTASPRSSARPATSCGPASRGATRSTRWTTSRPAQTHSPTRTLPIGSLDAGLIFERDSGIARPAPRSRSSRACCTSTCRSANQDDLPLFDTAPAGPEPGPAVPHQPLRRRGPRERCEPGERRRHEPPVRRGQRHAVSRRHPRPDLLLRIAAGAPAGRAACATATARTSSPSSRSPPTRTGTRTSALQWNPDESRSERAQVNVQYRPGPRAGRERRLPLPAGPPRAGRGLQRLADRAALERLRPLRLFASRTTRPSSTSPASNTAPAAGGCGSWAAASSAAAPASRTRASTCSWNSPGLPVSDRRRMLSSPAPFADTRDRTQDR